jgi:hypothetical protein
MKKVVYKGLYAIVLSLTNRFNIRLLSGLKIFLGTTLLVLMSSCVKKEEEPEITCYDPAQSDVTCYLVDPPKENAAPEPAQPATASINLDNS